MSDRKFAQVKPANDTLAKVYFEEKELRAQARNSKPHRGRKEVTVNGVTYTYRVGRGYVEIWNGDHKLVVKHHEVLGMTEQEYRATNHIMLCETCESYDCPAGYSKYPLNIAVTPGKVRDFIANRSSF